MLTKGGADVTIVDIWPEHVMHMKAKGLTVKCAWANKNLGDASYTVPVGDRHSSSAHAPTMSSASPPAGAAAREQHVGGSGGSLEPAEHLG